MFSWEGTFCLRGRLTPPAFDTALAFAADIASRSCASFGTRAWMRA
ncbi:hypothetical protein PV341_44615 [Streptomyces sp. PA03-1a]|nr:hypothetical protein [Streptomyces sp. PA03-1a]